MVTPVASSKKIWVIGDIQGCFVPFKNLLEKIRYTPEHHELWLTGDLVNRGPESLEMLEWAFVHRQDIRLVLGNHDLHLLTQYYKIRPAFPDDTLDALLASEKAPEWIEWLRAQPLAHYSKAHDLLMVHAGIEPSWTEEQTLAYAQEISKALSSPDYRDYLSHLYGNQPAHWSEALTGEERLRALTNFLTRVRFCDSTYGFDNQYKGEISQAPQDLKPWYLLAENLKPRTRVVFGHWSALNGMTGTPKFINLDTGCVWGKTLTAWNPETDERVSVPGLER